MSRRPRLAGAHSYMEIVGCLLYIACNARPDVAFAVYMLSRRTHNPSEAMLAQAMRTLTYLLNTKARGLFYHRGSTAEVIAYSDADKGNTDNGKDIAGSIV